MPQKIKVLIVDDHRLVAEALLRVLSSEPDVDVLGVVGSVGDLGRMQVQAPDVVLMDYWLDDGTGPEASHVARARWPAARIVMVTGVKDADVMLATLQAGADGYVTKDRALDDVVAAVRDAHVGRVMLSPAIIAAISRRLTEGPSEDTPARRLTARELEVLKALSTGSATQSIAADLGIGEGTVRTHVEAIRRKLSARSRLEAVAKATRLGILSKPPA